MNEFYGLSWTPLPPTPEGISGDDSSRLQAQKHHVRRTYWSVDSPTVVKSQTRNSILAPLTIDRLSDSHLRHRDATYIVAGTVGVEGSFYSCFNCIGHGPQRSPIPSLELAVL